MKNTHRKISRLLALLLVMALVVPMVLTARPVAATTATEATELPTETITVEAGAEEEVTPVFSQWHFSDETDLADFDLYQSATSKFVVSDGMLMADGTDGEQKAILNKDVSKIESVSVNLIPGESGVIYGGVYVGANNPTDTQDDIDSMVFLIKSDYTGWSDAPNRIDIVQGKFDGSWTHIQTTISETGSGNNLFSGGVKEALTLKLTFSDDVILLKLSLASNPDKYVQIMYEVEPEQLQGSVGLRSIGSDTCYDKLIVNENYVPVTLTEGLKLDGTGLDSYGKTLGNMTQKPVTIEAWVWVPKLTGGSRRQAIITNYTEPTVAKNAVGTWGLYTNEYTTLYYTERTSEGTFNKTLGVPVCNNSWNHVAIVRSPGVLHVYWNGEFVQSIEHAGIGDTTVVENPMTIGYCSVGAGTESLNSLKGQVGDIRLWSTERTQAQLQANMYRELEGTEEGLIQHWNFDSQQYGVVSNTVEGGLDVELLGHTQIGDEHIRRWDFSDATQLEDFTVYADSGKSGAGSFVVQDDGTLYCKSGQNYSVDMKAILNTELENIQSMSVNMYPGTTVRFNGGFYLGAKNEGSSDKYCLDATAVVMGMCRSNSANLARGEIFFNQLGDGTNPTLHTVADYDYFTDKIRVPVNLLLNINNNTVTATMTQLDNPDKILTTSYEMDEESLDGKVGIYSSQSNQTYDDLTIVYKEDTAEDTPAADDTLLYNNQGYSFFQEDRPWKITEDLSSTPYTLEAWVKVPVGVDDNSAGYIVGNASRAPSISMQMIADGKLQLSYAVENADLTVTTKTFDVDTDLRTGKWTHVAYTCDVAADTVTAYINGVAAATWTQAGLTAITIPDKIIPGNTFTIGSLESNDDPADPLIGWIADVRLWDRALTAEEISDSMMTQYTLPRDGMMFNAPLSAKTDDSFADLSGNGYVVQAYDTMLHLEAETHEPGAYSMVVIPDQQILSHFSPERLNAMYQWIADNREKENIQIVMNVGDMADNCGNLDQWANNKAAWELLPDDLPFIVSPGNHDYDTNSGWNKGYGDREQLTLMNEYFPRSLFESYPTEIGFFDEVNSANQWQSFSVYGNNYLVLALEYVPQDDVLAWAGQVAQSHPDHQIILVTHNYMGSYGNLNVPNVWNQFVSQHENVIMAFSGHVWHTNVVRRTDTGVNGNQVHQILMDAQVSDTGSEGNKYAAMIGLLRFNADGTQCEVSYYSTDRDMYDTGSNFTLTLPKQEHIYYASVGTDFYQTVTEAAAAANGQVVKLLMSSDEAVTINADVTLDLAGNSLTNVTVTNGCSLKLIDTTAAASGVSGSAAVTGAVDAYTTANGVSYVAQDDNGVYTVSCYAMQILQQVSLQDDIAMRFAVKADAAALVNVTFDGYTTTLALSELPQDSNGYYTFSVNLAAAQMTELIHLQFTVDGTVIFERDYSVRKYAQALLEGSYPEDMVNLVKWMLNYGAKAQQHFLVNTDDLANAGYELDEIALPTEYTDRVITGSISGLEYYGVSLIFTNKIAVRFYFTGSVEGVSFGGYEPVQKGNLYYVEIPGINPQEYNKSIVLTATKGDETLSVSYSPLNYIVRMSQRDTSTAELKALLNAMYGYHRAAVQYVIDSAATYQVISGAVSESDGVITSTAADTMLLHGNVAFDSGSFYAELNTVDNSKAAGIVFGADATGENYYVFRMGNGSKVELVKVSAGVETVVDTGYYPANRRANRINGLQIVNDGDTVHGYVHNSQYGKVHCFAVHTEQTFAGNRIGLWSAADGVTFQNIQLTDSTQLRSAEVLIFGHSYTEMWTDYADYFPEYPDIDNVGIGGSVAVQWEQFPEELASYNPSLGIYMIGINDLTGGTEPKAVISSMEKTLLQIKELVPEFEVIVTAVNHCPNRSTITQQISDTNALMRNLAASYDWIYYAETEYALCTDPTDPLSADASLFTDGLHPNADGYALLVAAIQSAAKGENQPEFDEALAQAQMAEAKAAKIASLSVYGETSYTAENWVTAQPYYDAALAKIEACSTEVQLQNVDLSAELAALDQIPNKGMDVISHVLDPETSDVRTTVTWTQADEYRVTATDFVYSLDNTAMYADSEAVFQLSNPSAGVGTAGLLLRGQQGANLGMYGYLVNINTNGNYIQIYYLNNSYNNDSTTTITKYIGGIVLNNYGINAVGTDFYAKIEGSTLYVNTLARHLAGEANMAAIDLTYDGAYEVYGQGHTGILSWTSSSFDLALKRFAGAQIDTNMGDEIIANLLNADTRVARSSSLDWTMTDAYTVNANGYNYSLDGTAVYSDSEAVIKLSNASGNIGTAGLLLRATATENNGINGYLVNVNTNSNYIQVYHLSNNYNTDSSTATHTYVGGVVLNNYDISAEGTEFYVKIEGSTLYVNTVERQQAGTNVLATIDLTKSGAVTLYESGNTGVLSWVSGVSFDFQLKDFQS